VFLLEHCEEKKAARSSAFSRSVDTIVPSLVSKSGTHEGGEDTRAKALAFLHHQWLPRMFWSKFRSRSFR